MPDITDVQDALYDSGWRLYSVPYSVQRRHADDRCGECRTKPLRVFGFARMNERFEMSYRDYKVCLNGHADPIGGDDD